jgi:hypothetical protein
LRNVHICELASRPEECSLPQLFPVAAWNRY